MVTKQTVFLGNPQIDMSCSKVKLQVRVNSNYPKTGILRNRTFIQSNCNSSSKWNQVTWRSQSRWIVDVEHNSQWDFDLVSKICAIQNTITRSGRNNATLLGQHYCTLVYCANNTSMVFGRLENMVPLIRMELAPTEVWLISQIDVK